MNGGGAIGALFFTVGVLFLFALMFGIFLILPFFLFLAGIIAMMISDRRRGRKSSIQEAAEEEERVGAAELIERDRARRRAT